ncbi:MAG: hypothetical protein ABI877_10400 [Gemmatimonadaceae bacterium]
MTAHHPWPAFRPRARSYATSAFLLAVLVLFGTSPLHGQRLRDRLSQLFIFGSGQDPLFLAGSATSSNPANVRVHGSHYIPAAVAENGSVIGFITGALASRVSNVPIGATTSGVTFRFEGGVPVSTSTSSGPIFAERSQTLGHGRVLAGISRSSFDFTSLRGTPLDALRLTFTHENVDFPGCDAIAGDDCTNMGVPSFENDVMNFDLSLNIHVAVTSFYLTYGLSDRVDFGIVIPVLSNSFDGSSLATIVPFGPGPASHFFAGTATNPTLTANRFVSGKASGIGDVATRLKINVHQSATTGVALLFDGRFPTGDEADLLGSGKFAGRAIGILSSTFGAFSPHVNLGLLYSADTTRNNVVLATAGFDHLLGKGITMAAEVVSEFQMGESKLHLPNPVHIGTPFNRVINPTSIPNIRDDIVNGSFGFKFAAANRTTVVTNALFPLNDGGLRARLTYTLGVEYAY